MPPSQIIPLLQAAVEDVEADNANLQDENAELQAEIANLKATIKSLKTSRTLHKTNGAAARAINSKNKVLNIWITRLTRAMNDKLRANGNKALAKGHKVDVITSVMLKYKSNNRNKNIDTVHTIRNQLVKYACTNYELNGPYYQQILSDWDA
jgi:cell division septum initiation protein DivIVA